MLAAPVEDRLRRPVDDAVEVLHAGDAHRQRLAELCGRHVAEADPADLARVSQRRQLRELVVEVNQLVALGDDAWRDVHPAHVDHADLIDPERGQVGLDLGAQLLRPLGRDEAAAGVPFRPDLAHQHQVVGVGRQRGADERVAVAVELRGVDVVDARADRLPQHRERRVPVRVPALQLHRAEADAGDRPPRQPRGAARSGDGAAWNSVFWPAVVIGDPPNVA